LGHTVWSRPPVEELRSTNQNSLSVKVRRDFSLALVSIYQGVTSVQTLFNKITIFVGSDVCLELREEDCSSQVFYLLSYGLK
jgi:hypothetical protein